MRLSLESLVNLNASVDRAHYDAPMMAAGIVHFGIGAFHRAHQAVYTDDAMNAGDRDWRIIGVSLRSPGVALQMNPQDGLFTVNARDTSTNTIRLVESVERIIVASEAPDQVIASLAAPQTRIVTLTITEKGYLRRSDGGLDLELAAQGSAYGFLTDGLKERCKQGLPGLTIISCDNLASNGAVFTRLFTEYLTAKAPELVTWFAETCRCPSTMVDRIVPATTNASRDATDALLGVRDEACVITEPFRQWVIEDAFAGDRPRWEAGGAVFVRDVHPYEVAKLRMLNGAHSALAYLGLARGHTFVHQAIGDPYLQPKITALMSREAAPTIETAEGQDLESYAQALLQRFANASLNHRLDQIAMDGTQKIPQRWLAVLAANQRANRPSPVILEALAAWLQYVRGDFGPVNDPNADLLAAHWTAHADDIVDAIFGLSGLLASDWMLTETDRLSLHLHLLLNHPSSVT